MLLALLATIISNLGEEAEREVVRRAAAKMTLTRTFFGEKDKLAKGSNNVRGKAKVSAKTTLLNNKIIKTICLIILET